MAVYPESRYNYSEVIVTKDANGLPTEKPHLGIRPRLNTEDQSDIRQFVPGPEETWSRIGYARLGDGRRYWVVADYSGIIDPFRDLRKRERLQYVTQLAQPVPASGIVDQIVVADARRLRAGMKLRVENLDPGNYTSYDVQIVNVVYSSNTVVIHQIDTVLAVPTALSRVSLVYSSGVALRYPDPERVLFDVLDFNNRLSVLQE